ncbi:hypothetical protein EV643_107233 [Kribbella sp. VKM Ac-2527]|uniref:Vegetative cell wall protein gp1 n=1 Tax=Kribbella caucasensis TaxID=2512215 RepID=A0A4R6KIT9_9ACTN|nr:hypothetical protein [Kribbella sp. VKM Ac-2527]TDO48603.1 hypothetical protein EV643_107233 [Kribbella sp. VKM Ac-2527]
MAGLLAELGKKLAERWLTLLVLPGALYLAVIAAAVALGQTEALAPGRLTDQFTTWATSPTVSSLGGQIVVLGAVLAGAAGAGIAAQALASVLERLWLAADWHTWPWPLRALANAQVNRRRQRWTVSAGNYQEERDQAALLRTRGQRADPLSRHAAYHRLTRIAPEYPARPTWCGDRIHAVAVRIERDLRLDLSTVWPPLWLTLPEAVRAEIQAARLALSRAFTLGAWAILYVVLAIWWWPAALIALGVAVAALTRARTATDTYAVLLESATHLYAGDLARQLGLETSGPFTADTAAALSELLHRAPFELPDN